MDSGLAAKRKGDEEDASVSSADDEARKKLRPASEISFNEMPHEILLLIFKYLNTKEICQMSRVCKKWRRVAYDEILWYHLDFSQSFMTLNRLKKLFKHRCFRNVKSISICGVLKNPFPLSQKQSVSDSLMAQLREACPNLIELQINYSDLKPVKSSAISSKVEHLSLLKCEIPLKWFDENRLDKLVYLDLSGSVSVAASHLEGLVNCRDTLETLKLKGCYRIKDKAVELLIEKKFDKLKSLDFQETELTELAVHLICTRMTNRLEYLNIKSCKHLVNTDKNFILSSFKENESFELVI